MPDGQLPAFAAGDLEPKPPAKTWTCTKCGSDKVVAVSGLDARERYAIANCTSCHRVRVMVTRYIPPSGRKETP